MSNDLEQAVGIAQRAAEIAQDAADNAARIAANMAAEGGEQAAELVSHGAGAAIGADPTVFRLAIFAMACFVGYYVVWQVTPALHTPLMSVTNAISSVIIVGALISAGVNLAEGTLTTQIFGFLGVVLAAVNIFGGFLVTQRMLAMYRKK